MGGHRLRRYVVGGLLVAAVTVLVTTAVAARSAPPRLVATFPADGAVLDRPPAEVSATFTTPLSGTNSHITLAPGEGGVALATGPARIEGDRLTVPVTVDRAGGFLAGYHVTLADGRELSGSIRFTVRSAGTPGQPAEAVPATQPAEAAPAARAATSAPAVAAGAHDHGGGGDPFNTVLLVVDLVLVVATVGLLLFRPRSRHAPPDGTARGKASPDALVAEDVRHT